LISEKNKQLVEAGLALLTPPGLKCTKHQIRRASKHLHAAILALSVEARKEELKRRRLAKLKTGELINCINTRKALATRWERYEQQCSDMTNEEFRKLSSPWEAVELAGLLGISVSRVTAYRRKAQTRRVPNTVAQKLLALIERTTAEEQAQCLPGLEEYLASSQQDLTEQN
jgi:hypothetical protein